MHPRLRKTFEERKNLFQNLQPNSLIDWGAAELLAYGTLLLEGNTVRISGQDVERG
jgi:2-oxoglutarate dehydrogenase E1 component